MLLDQKKATKEGVREECTDSTQSREATRDAPDKDSDNPLGNAVDHTQNVLPEEKSPTSMPHLGESDSR